MRVAICGIRGVPACYGGFETFAEELGQRLVRRGHTVVVYGRRHVIHYSEPSYLGMDLRLLAAPRHKYFETPVHTLLSFVDLLRRPVDVVLLCNAANSPFAWLPRLRGMPVAINLDGIERKRAKWNAVGRAWYAFGELCSVLFGSKLIADAEMIAEYYAQVYRAKTSIIRYGCIAVSPEEIASKLEHASGFELRQSALLGEGCSIFSELPVFSESAVAPGGYFLYVSRLEPENNAHRVIASYNALPTEIKLKFPLLIVGDAPYAKDYITGLHREAGEGIHFLGYRFGEQYRALQLGAYAYIQATEVGGTHPALVEAMGFGNCVLANTTPEHSEALANAGLYYAKNNLAELTSLMRSVAGNPELVLEKRKAAYQRAQKEFSWERITNDYEELLTGLLS